MFLRYVFRYIHRWIPNNFIVRATLDLVVANVHCVKSIRIQSISGPQFPAFGLNTERSGAEYFSEYSPNAGK